MGTYCRSMNIIICRGRICIYNIRIRIHYTEWRVEILKSTGALAATLFFLNKKHDVTLEHGVVTREARMTFPLPRATHTLIYYVFTIFFLPEYQQ